MKNKFRLKRIVSTVECPWLDENIDRGTIVYEYCGHTYGCIGSGIACTKEPGITPFFELPFDALEKFEEREN